VASVDRLMLVELIEAEKAKLSLDALELWKELEESHYFSNESERIINEDFSSEEAATFVRHQSHQIDVLKRFEQMPECDRRTKNVLSELRMGLKRSDDAESRGEPAQPYREKCVINASIMKDRDERGPRGSMRVEEFASRTVSQALARLGERSQLEAPQDVPDAPETANEQQGRGRGQATVRALSPRYEWQGATT
jgi:hypothetical protein